MNDETRVLLTAAQAGLLTHDSGTRHQFLFEGRRVTPDVTTALGFLVGFGLLTYHTGGVVFPTADGLQALR